jgi:hypothetical protein
VHHEEGLSRGKVAQHTILVHAAFRAHHASHSSGYCGALGAEGAMTGCRQQPTSTVVTWALSSALQLALIVGAAAACGRTHPYVGFSAPFESFEHEVG